MRSHLDTYLGVVLLVLLQQVDAQLCQVDQVLQPLAWRDCRLGAILCKLKFILTKLSTLF
jgi:hypothetical protein